MELFNRVTMRDRTASVRVRKNTMIFNTAASRMAKMDKTLFVHFVKTSKGEYGFIVNNNADGYPISVIGATSSQVGCSKFITMLGREMGMELEDSEFDITPTDKVYETGDQVFALTIKSNEE